MPSSKETRSQGSRKKKSGKWEREVSAGGVIFHTHGHHVLLIKDSYGRWALPKGHIEKGESAEDAALRECSEETGIPLTNLRPVEKLGYIKYIYQRGGKKFFKIVTFFLVESTSRKTSHQIEEVQDARWFGPDEAYEKIEYRNTKEIMKKAVEKIKAK